MAGLTENKTKPSSWGLAELGNVIEEKRTKIETLENANNENAKNMKSLSSKETIQTPNKLKKFKCSKYHFETDHEQGFKVHVTRKHTVITSGNYPKNCHPRERKFIHKVDFKNHMKTCTRIVSNPLFGPSLSSTFMTIVS